MFTTFHDNLEYSRMLQNNLEYSKMIQLIERSRKLEVDLEYARMFLIFQKDFGILKNDLTFLKQFGMI